MPSYADGSPARVGDLVRGRPNSTPRVVVGQLVEIGGERNCLVAFLEVVDVMPGEELPGAVYLVVADGRGGMKRIRLLVRHDYADLHLLERILTSPSAGEPPPAEPGPAPDAAGGT